MKSICFFIAFLLLPVFVEAQTKTLAPDVRLAGLFEADYLQRLQTLQPVQLERLNFYLDNSYEIQAMPEGKGDSGLAEVSIDNLAAFNIIAFERAQNLFRDANSPKIFRIKGTSKILILLPESEFVKKFNAWRGK